MSKPVVLLYEPIHEKAIAFISKRAEVRQARSLDEDELIQVVGDVDGIIVRANGKVSRRLMEAAPRLKVVGRHGVGVETIDLEAAADLNIQVVNTPEANLEAVAEHCIGMMIALAKRFREADHAMRASDWDARYRLIGSELFGKALSIIGCGRIGQRVAEIGHRAFSMDVIYHDVIAYPEVEAELGARRSPLHEALSVADFVSIHTPLLPATKGLIDVSALRSMKPGAFLINSSRGAVVDQAALVRALREDWIAGAGLDVYDPEPLPAGSPLLALENVILSPHMAAHTGEALFNMAMVAIDVLAVIEGKEPENPVRRPP
jgi:D-3-phosphoglycerate dehydrogenase